MNNDQNNPPKQPEPKTYKPNESNRYPHQQQKERNPYQTNPNSEKIR